MRIGPGVPIYGRRTRAALLVLLLLPVLAAAGMLFVKYQLETFRDTVTERAQDRLKLRFDTEEVEVNGLRGLRVRGFDAVFTTPLGPRLHVVAPETFIDIDLVDLFYGQMTVERIQVDGATFTLSHDPGTPWFSAPSFAGSMVPGNLSFRVSGSHCVLRVEGDGDTPPVEIRELAFDVSRLPDSPDTVGRVYGLLGQEAQRPLQSTFRYGATEDFDLRVSGLDLAASTLNALLPTGMQLADGGTVAPNIRLSGYPDQTMVVSIDAPFEALALANANLLPPLTGSLTLLAGYNLDTHQVKLTSARIDTGQVRGDLTGSLSLAQRPYPMDLRIAIEEFPVREIARSAVQSALGEYGQTELEIGDAHRINLALRGTLQSPVFSIEAEMEQGAVTFNPEDDRYPSAALEVGMVALSWDSSLKRPMGTLNITGGTLRHKPLGLTAEQVVGTLSLRPGEVLLEPLTARMADNTLTGHLRYDFEDKTATYAMTGLLAGVERIALIEGLGKAGLTGDVHLQCTGSATSDRVILDGAVDLTRAAVEYDWFLYKPAGMGGSIQDLHLEMKPKNSMTLSGTLEAATSEVAFDARLGYRAGTWQAEAIDARSDKVNLATTSEYLRLPYSFTGETATEGSFSWRPSPSGTPKKGLMTAALLFPEVTMTPGNGIAPLALTNAKLTATIDDGTMPIQVGLTVDAETARVPAIGSPWLPPFRPRNEELDARFPRNPIVTHYDFQADEIVLPPWRGTNFDGSGRFSPEESGIQRFAADIEGGGRLEGAYTIQRENNIGNLEVAWTDVAATYLIQYMDFPELLTGTLTGEIRYAVDRDDPSTLKGGGQIEIREGQFSADFVAQLLATQLDADMASLPPSLAFDRLRTDIDFDGDRITTDNLLLASEGIQISGGGYFILEGDMDYMIDVSISPETASRIPVLAQNLNVSGHKVTQTDIKLAFHITGPAISPSGRVAGLPPVGVTLVNGAISVGGEVVKIIDAPRQILMDVFKIIGGAVGAGGRKQ